MVRRGFLTLNMAAGKRMKAATVASGRRIEKRSVSVNSPVVLALRERWLTANDVAARLHIRPRTVALWAQQGRLPAYRLGNYLRFRWDEVENALAASCRVVLPDGHHQKAEILKSET
jgi:excisionase family DNA binding protein